MKPQIHIYNLRDHKKSYAQPPHYCDRRSPLGNPFTMNGKNLAERNRVCDLYEENWSHMLEDEKASTMFSILVKEAFNHPIALLCWCAPKRCHCETIKRKIEEALYGHGVIS